MPPPEKTGEGEIARLDRVVAHLAEMRQAATDPRTVRYLREQERAIRAVLDFLREMRAEMHNGPHG